MSRGFIFGRWLIGRWAVEPCLDYPRRVRWGTAFVAWGKDFVLCVLYVCCECCVQCVVCFVNVCCVLWVLRVLDVGLGCCVCGVFCRCSVS